MAGDWSCILKTTDEAKKATWELYKVVPVQDKKLDFFLIAKVSEITRSCKQLTNTKSLW